jgi:hypothetical protein
MENAKKIILGKNFKASEKFGNSLVEGAICLDILNDESIKKFIYEYDGKTYLNIKVVERREPSKFGKTHYIEVDQFVPQSKEEAE